MYRIYHPTHLNTTAHVYATIADAVRAFVDAGCPSDRVNGVCQGAWVYDVAGNERTVSLFPRLPDRFAGMTRADLRAAYDGGLRAWTYPTWWSAWLKEQGA